jgi:hypothetical protein
MDTALPTPTNAKDIEASSNLSVPKELPPESPYSIRAMETELAVQRQIDSGELDRFIWPNGKPPQV